MAIAGQGGARYHKRDFRADENLKYAEPHFRMRKVAREVRRIARGRECDLLDVGCGPGTLARLMPPGVRYHGVDIAIPASAPNLIEMDIIEEPVSFRGRRSTSAPLGSGYGKITNIVQPRLSLRSLITARADGRIRLGTGLGESGGAREQDHFRNARGRLRPHRGMQQSRSGA